MTLCALTALTLPVSAFPPSPHHVLYGLVRDELGNPLAVRNAEVILQTQAGTRLRASVIPFLEPGGNYRLSVPLDAGLTEDLYKPTALRPTVPFKLSVRIGTATFLPIEMSANFAQMGQPAQTTRLDLTLGEDTDGDGLPDAWERALLALKAGSLKDINPDDDFDGDGLSNLQEYLAGTYAFDDKDGFTLKAIRRNGGLPVLEFMAVRGRSYRIYGSANLHDWSEVPFKSAGQSEGSMQSHFQASDTRVMQVEVNPRLGSETMGFFKLMVR